MPWPNPTATCTIKDLDAFGRVIAQCTRPHASRGWCSRHYKRWQRTGSTGGVDPVPRGRPKAVRAVATPTPTATVVEAPERKCSVVEVDAAGRVVAECTRPHAARGYCSAHHRRWMRTGGENGGNPGPVEIGPGGRRIYQLDTECTVKGCHRSISAKGLCKRHYERASETGSPTGSRTRAAAARDVAACEWHEGCDRPAESRGLCGTHYAKQFAVELAAETGRPKCASTDEDCPVAVYSNGLCRRHHDAAVRERQRQARQGDTRRDADPRGRVRSEAA